MDCIRARETQRRAGLVLVPEPRRRRDPIFTLAYLPNGFIYVRNLYLTHRTSS
jgi:lipid-A-disaccharide synthase-like uncharacterized protein